MDISLKNSRASGFKKCSDAHKLDSTDDQARGGSTTHTTAPDIDVAAATPPVQTHRPWLMPGVGNAF